MSEILGAVGALIEWLIQAIRDGASDEEIIARMRAPGSVGRSLIAAVRKRRSAIDDYIANG